jgi:hypothetical protein
MMRIMTSQPTLHRRAGAGAPELDLLRRVAVRVPCTACGRYYSVTLRQVLLAQQLAHEGCPARHEPECPPVIYSRLANEGALHDFDESWWRLVEGVRAAGFELRL